MTRTAEAGTFREGKQMRIGIQVPHFKGVEPHSLGPWLRDLGRAAEDAGFSSFWMMDHFFQLGEWLGPAESPMLEGYTAVSQVAAVTERIEIGVLATCVAYRHPGVLLKMVTTLDVLSGGRAWLGIGAGWYEEEAAGLGIPFPPLAVRYEQLEETLRLAKQMFSGDQSPFHGRHYDLTRPLNSPRPIRRPHPPILVAGSGARRTLRLAAAYADACNIGGLYDSSAGEIAATFDALKGHCLELGRNFDEIERTVLDTLDGVDRSDTGELVARCQEMREAGAQTVIFNMTAPYSPALVHRIGTVLVPALA
jgi:F420-dependent oxidoreductase-like protein